jgi:hypothetical protein
MLRRVALIETDVPEERSAPIIWVTRLGELGTMLAINSNRLTLRRNTSVRRLLVTANNVPSLAILATLMMGAVPSTRHNIPQDGILHFITYGVHI